MNKKTALAGAVKRNQTMSDDDNTYDGYDEIIAGENSDQEIPEDYDNFATEQESSNVYPIKKTDADFLNSLNKHNAAEILNPDGPPSASKMPTANEQALAREMKKEARRRQINEGWDDEEIEIPDAWFTTKPAPREYIIENFLPLGVVGIIGAKGGTGKSMLCMQMAISVAGGYGGGEFFGHCLIPFNRTGQCGFFMRLHKAAMLQEFLFYRV